MFNLGATIHFISSLKITDKLREIMTNYNHCPRYEHIFRPIVFRAGHAHLLCTETWHVSCVRMKRQVRDGETSEEEGKESSTGSNRKNEYFRGRISAAARVSHFSARPRATRTRTIGLFVLRIDRAAGYRHPRVGLDDKCGLRDGIRNHVLSPFHVFFLFSRSSFSVTPLRNRTGLTNPSVSRGETTLIPSRRCRKSGLAYVFLIVSPRGPQERRIRANLGKIEGTIISGEGTRRERGRERKRGREKDREGDRKERGKTEVHRI